MRVTELLDRSVDVTKLKDYLGLYSHPLYPEQKYVEPVIYKHANTPGQLLKLLHPKLVNYQNYYLLEEMVEEFGCDEYIDNLTLDITSEG